MFEDSVATDNETDGFNEVGFLRKNHIKNVFFSYLKGTLIQI